MFFHIELVMRPRKFRFLSIFNSSTPQWFAYYSYFLSAYFRTIMQLNYIPMAVNRFTAFATPFYYKKVLKLITTRHHSLDLENTVYCLLYLCTLDICFDYNIEYVSMGGYKNGMEHFTNWGYANLSQPLFLCNYLLQSNNTMFQLDAIVSTTVCTVSCFICIILYSLAAWYSSKSRLQHSAQIEKKLFGCSVLATVPLLVECAKSLVLLWATITNNRDMLVFLTEFWFVLYNIGKHKIL